MYNGYSWHCPLFAVGLMVRFKERCRAMSARAGLIETDREQPTEVIAKWNRSGSAVCPDGYDYIARIRRCVARTVTAGAVPPQRNRRGSAVCPEGYNYQSRYKACLPQ